MAKTKAAEAIRRAQLIGGTSIPGEAYRAKMMETIARKLKKPKPPRLAAPEQEKEPVMDEPPAPGEQQPDTTPAASSTKKPRTPPAPPLNTDAVDKVAEALKEVDQAKRAAELAAAKKLGGDEMNQGWENRIKNEKEQERIAKEEKAKKPKTFWSERARQDYDLKEKLRGKNMSEAEINKQMAKTIRTGSTNVPGSVEGLPESFLEDNKLTLEPTSKMPQLRGKDGFTPEDKWQAMTEFKNPAAIAARDAAQAGAPAAALAPQAAPIRPGDQPFHDVLGPAWAGVQGEAGSELRNRRIDLIRAAVTENVQYGTVGTGTGEIRPRASIPAPEGSRGFVSNYGGGFATGLPSAAPVPPQYAGNKLQAAADSGTKFTLPPRTDLVPEGSPMPDMSKIPIPN